MKIYKLHIENFRGIKETDWIIDGGIACLIGPGDSTKTTILESIRTLLLPTNYISISEADFYNYDIKNKIIIEAVVGNLPESIIKEFEIGMDLCGWDINNNKLNDEPEDTDELVLRIRFSVDDSFEPEWSVFNERNPDGKKLSSRIRDIMNMYWLGSYADKDLSITQGSALQRVVGSNKSVKDKFREIGSIVKDQFKETVDTDDSLAELQSQVNAATTVFGLSPSLSNCSSFVFGFDLTNKLGNIGTISLFENKIPVKLMGEGSKRLMSMSVQSLTQNEGSIFLLDEVEHALEPYRIRHLVRELINKSKQGSQIFLTTHSSVAITEFDSNNIYIVRCKEGIVTINKVGKELQSISRGSPEALLSKKIIMVEGDTEEGICIELDKYWNESEKKNFGVSGISIANGQGSNYLDRSKKLASLGYPILLFIDSDLKSYSKKEKDDMEEIGITLVQWKDKRHTEASIFSDLPFNCFQQLINIAVDYKGEESIKSLTSIFLSKIKNCNIQDWRTSYTEDEIKAGLIAASNKGEWYKRTDQGRKVGEIITDNMANIKNTDMEKCINEIKKWAYGG